MKDFPLEFTVAQKRSLAKDVLLCELALSGGQDFVFHPGQYLSLLIPDGGEMKARSFSIASHPEKDVIDIIIKMRAGGLASNFFSNVAIGEKIHGSMPEGKFVLDEKEQPSVFICAGAGIAPIIPMVIELLKKRTTEEPVQLLFYKEPEGYDELIMQLESLSSDHPHFKYNIVTDEGESTQYLSGCDDSLTGFYICGGPEFVVAMRSQLVEKGVSGEDIHFEQ